MRIGEPSKAQNQVLKYFYPLSDRGDMPLITGQKVTKSSVEENNTEQNLCNFSFVGKNNVFHTVYLQHSIQYNQAWQESEWNYQNQEREKNEINLQMNILKWSDSVCKLL